MDSGDAMNKQHGISDATFRLMIEADSDIIILFDSAGLIRYANPSFFHTFAVKPKEVTGKKLSSIIRPHLGDCSAQIQRDLDTCRSCSYHGVFFDTVDTGDRTGPFCVSCDPLEVNGNQANLLILKDMKPVSEYIDRIEEVSKVVEKERNYLREILDGIADGYYITSVDRSILRVNKKLLQLLGRREEEVVGKSCQSILASGSCENDCPLTWVAKNFKPILNSPETITRIDGERIPVRKSTFPVLNMDGTLSGSICIIHNRSEVETLRNKLAAHGLNSPLISNNKRMQEIFELIISMKDSDPFVLLTGESGTGKEIIANAIVENSTRKNKTFLKINCSALPEGLLESELFGHRRGSFTGAVTDKLGKVVMANGGTILLDEIGDMPMPLQAKLLRFIENGEIQPIGSTRTEKVDVRIIAATNQDLKEQIAKGLFREDLYYRLCVIPIDLPPLRERKEDLPLLINHFIKTFNKRYGKQINDISARAFAMLMEYDWPGNIRELRNAIEHAFACVSGDLIERISLPQSIRRAMQFHEHEFDSPLKKQQLNREIITELLRKYNGNREKTAQALHISRTTLWRKIKTLNIKFV